MRKFDRAIKAICRRDGKLNSEVMNKMLPYLEYTRFYGKIGSNFLQAC